MSHEVESMFYQHNTPWHGLGTFVDHPPTAEEAIKAAGLDWNVVTEPVFLSDGHRVTAEESMNNTAVVREHDRRVFAIMGKQYTPLQNQEAFRFFDPFVQEGHFQYETAGSLKGGRRVWVLASLTDGTREVVKDDPVKAHLLLTNTHDGSSPVISVATNVRVVCWNTMQMAVAEGSPVSRARHTRNMQLKMETMQESVAKLHTAFEQALEQYKFLASAQINARALELYVKALFGRKEDSEGLPKGGASIISLFESGRGNQMPNVRGTMWAAFNAVTEHIDHHRGSSNIEKRLESAWFGQGSDLKEKALQLAIKGAMALKAA